MESSRRLAAVLTGRIRPSSEVSLTAAVAMAESLGVGPCVAPVQALDGFWLSFDDPCHAMRPSSAGEPPALAGPLVIGPGACQKGLLGASCTQSPNDPYWNDHEPSIHDPYRSNSTRAVVQTGPYCQGGALGSACDRRGCGHGSRHWYCRTVPAPARPCRRKSRRRA